MVITIFSISYFSFGNEGGDKKIEMVCKISSIEKLRTFAPNVYRYMYRILKYIKSKAFVKSLLWAFLCFVCIIFLTFYSLRFYTKHGDGVSVPMLRNLPLKGAVELLEKNGLTYEVDSVYVMGKSPGVVLDYEPDYQSFVKSGRTIYLTVNTMIAPEINFPDIEYKSLTETIVMLSNMGLKLGDTTYKADVSRDVVLEATFSGATLKAGQAIPKGSKIDLILGNGIGNSQVNIPNLIGLTKEEAIFALRGSALKLGKINYNSPIIDTLTATIRQQSPILSDSVKKIPIGSAIHITLGN